MKLKLLRVTQPACFILNMALAAENAFTFRLIISSNSGLKSQTLAKSLELNFNEHKMSYV